jgi:multidrug resistance efflux pump
LGEHEIALAQQRYIASLNHRERLAVRSPFDGVVLDLPRLDDASVRRGDVIAVIEQRKKRQVTAWLNQDEVLRVGLGDEATVFVPGLGETLTARITRIDRTSGFVEEQKRAQNPGYRWRGPVDRTAKVTLEFPDPQRVANAERYRSGLPVVVIFPQRSTSSILASIGQGAGNSQ